MTDKPKKPLPLGVCISPPPPLTIRQRKFVARVVSGASPAQAARDIGAPGKGSLLMNQRTVQREIERCLRSAGIDETYAVTRLKELCEAEMATKDGKTKPDLNMRAKGFGYLKDIMGLDAPKKTETTTISFEERLLQVAGEEYTLIEGDDDTLEAEFDDIVKGKG